MNSTMKRKKILLASYGGGHINMLVPIYQELQSSTSTIDLDIDIMAFTSARTTLEAAGIPYFSFKDTPEFENSTRARSLGESLATQTSSLLPADETVAYMGCSMEDLIVTHGEDRARALFMEHGRTAFLPIGYFKSLLSREKYDLVVTTNSPRSEKALVFAAGELKIPSVVVVDLFDHREFRDRTAFPGYGTRVCVLSNYVRDEMIKLGRPADEIMVTGNPAFDKLSDPGLKSKAQQLRRERSWADKKVILWARGNDAESLRLNPSIEKRLGDYAAANPNTILAIRPHPNENLASLEFPPNAYISTRQDPLPPLLEASDLVITMLSTVGLEGALIGKPLIQLRMSEASHASPYIELGLAVGAYDLENLISHITNIFNEPRPSSPTDTMIPLGKSAQNVVKVIIELLR